MKTPPHKIRKTTPQGDMHGAEDHGYRNEAIGLHSTRWSLLFMVSQASLNTVMQTMDIYIFPCPPTPAVFFFFFPISHCWYKGVEETHSNSTGGILSFSWEGGVHARSMARLARITVISNLQFLLSKQFVAGRSRL